eukprot:scaffold5462_cov103-Skeletonema_dohrnii-CCMP3373.AAC.4
MEPNPNEIRRRCVSSETRLTPFIADLRVRGIWTSQRQRRRRKESLSISISIDRNSYLIAQRKKECQRPH